MKSLGSNVVVALWVGVFVVFGCVAYVYSVPSRGSAVAAAAVEPTGQSCTADDFSVSKTKGTVGYDVAKLTGIVASHCPFAAGVELKWTAYNADGSVAFSSDFWPASTTNIPPNSDYPFEMMNSAPRGKWTYEVEPVGIHKW